MPGFTKCLFTGANGVYIKRFPDRSLALPVVVLQSCHMDWGGVLIIFRDAKITATSVQMETLRTCGDYLCSRVVSAIFPVLS
jgi:hypothetical protein